MISKLMWMAICLPSAVKRKKRRRKETRKFTRKEYKLFILQPQFLPCLKMLTRKKLQQNCEGWRLLKLSLPRKEEAKKSLAKNTSRLINPSVVWFITPA
jgi:hypothetical protein